MHEAAAARRAVLRDEENLGRHREELWDALAAQARASADAAEVAKRIASQTQSVSALRAKLEAIPAWNEREQLTTAIADAERMGTERAQSVGEWLARVNEFVEWGRNIRAFVMQGCSEDLRRHIYAR